ncbi:MAG: tetratricopeptide repeat protein [Bacteroidetes bacterium]|nr:tetratricopeptide repeat protein [Bacteroidota bacterium]MBS1630346.1 tetratricopeptide repeat protein [Bacteroidota bacterium]
MRHLALCLLSLTLIFSACDHSNSKAPVIKVAGIEVPKLLPEDTVKGNADEQIRITSDFNKAISDLRANGDNPMPLLKLAEVFIQEGRISGNDVYYSSAAIKMLERVLQAESTTEDQRFYALNLKSMVLLRMHHYQAALETARQGLNIFQYNSGIWGCVSDAQIELGHYDSAVQACDRMVGIRPDLRSYARVAALREIFGKKEAAVEAMKMAVASGIPGLEPTEWARVQLGDLYFRQGKLDSAKQAYEYSLFYRPGYPAAQYGMAHVLAAKGNSDSAIIFAQAAEKSQPGTDFSLFLARLYERKGMVAEAQKIQQQLIHSLQEADALEAKDSKYKHDRTRDFALAFLAAGELEKAFSFAKKDYELRPSNIDVNELMAWLSYRKGDFASAKEYAEKALKTGAQNPALLYECGQIFSAAGDANRGTLMMQQALSVMPYLDLQTLAGRNQ